MAISLDALKEEIAKNTKSKSVFDIEGIIKKFLNRPDIDMITRIRDTELDKICNMLHHTHKISVLKIKRLSEIKLVDIKNNEDVKKNLCTGEIFVLQNLFLRLSLDSKSREELVNMFVSIIRTEIEMAKKLQNESQTNIKQE